MTAILIDADVEPETQQYRVNPQWVADWGRMFKFEIATNVSSYSHVGWQTGSKVRVVTLGRATSEDLLDFLQEEIEPDLTTDQIIEQYLA